jgi:Fe-S-cluster containining protein
MGDPRAKELQSLEALCFEVLSKGLGDDRSAARLLELVSKLQNGLLRQTERNRIELGYEERVACKRGCDSCCFRVVIAGVPDLVRAEAFVRSKLTPQQQKDLRRRLYQYERSVAPKFGLGLDSVRVACPFLVGGECEIYEARPEACRSIHSLDAAVCEAIKLKPETLLSRPSVPNENELHDAFSKGSEKGLRRVGLGTGKIDFARAMAVAVDEPDSIAKLFQGDNRFTPAAVRQPAAKIPRIAGITHYEKYAPGESPKGRIGTGDLTLHYEKLYDGDWNGAIAALDTQHPVRLIRKIFVPPLYRSEDEIASWRHRFERAIDELKEAAFDPREAFDALQAISTFELAYQQCNDREILSRLGDCLVGRITSQAFPDLSDPIERSRQQGKLKVGYISENLTISNGGSWARGWLNNHGPDIERYVFCLSDAPDAVTSRFAQAADHFHLLNQDVGAHARFIKSLKLDVLIYPDIGISGRNYQYASMRLAPVQCTAWGHPVTSGLPTIDYYLSSEMMEPPNGQDHYREKLVRLPGSGLCYPRRLFPPSRMTKADFGLDDGQLILSCQNPMKYLPRYDYLYKEICERTGRPIVFVEGPKPMDKRVLKERMAGAGVRAIWLPSLSLSDFFALIKVADVCIDTPGWNGGNTTVQALQERIPVVSLAGEFMRGRHSLAFCPIANAPGLVASGFDDYIDLICDEERIAEAMSKLEPERLFDDTVPVTALDEFLKRA